MLGQLPPERITPGSVFDKVGIDYAGPVLIKYGYVRKPTMLCFCIAIGKGSSFGTSDRPDNGRLPKEVHR